MHILLLSCLKASELIEKKIHFGLSFKEKIQLSLHKTMCDACRNYEKQSLFIEKSIESSIKTKKIEPDIEELKKSIRNRIDLLNKI